MMTRVAIVMPMIVLLVQGCSMDMLVGYNVD